MNHLPFVLIVSWFGYPRTILTPEWDLGVRIVSHDIIFLGTSLRRIHALSYDSLVYLESPGLRRMIVSYPDEISWSNYIRTRVLESPTQFGGWNPRFCEIVSSVRSLVLIDLDTEDELTPSMFH